MHECSLITYFHVISVSCLSAHLTCYQSKYVTPDFIRTKLNANTYVRISLPIHAMTLSTNIMTMSKINDKLHYKMTSGCEIVGKQSYLIICNRYQKIIRSATLFVP